MPEWWFRDREDAGGQLGRLLQRMHLGAVTVLGLPRGGVPVAAQVAQVLDSPLDVIAVRKLGLPGHPEVAMGAIGEGGITVTDPMMLSQARISAQDLAAMEAAERATLRSRLARLQPHRSVLDLTERDVVIVDDGIATGATMTAACRVARHKGAAHVFAAAPVGSMSAIEQIDGADRVFCVLVPEDFDAVGRYYRHFDQTADDEVERLLDASRSRTGRSRR